MAAIMQVKEVLNSVMVFADMLKKHPEIGPALSFFVHMVSIDPFNPEAWARAASAAAGKIPRDKVIRNT